MNPVVDKLVEDWFALLDYCQRPETFNQKHFGVLVKLWTSLYARLDFAAQGEITEQIAGRL